jgi:hypothetical protein
VDETVRPPADLDCVLWARYAPKLMTVFDPAAAHRLTIKAAQRLRAVMSAP